MAAPSTTVRLLALLLSVYLVSFLPKGSATSECPGILSFYPFISFYLLVFPFYRKSGTNHCTFQAMS